MGNNRQINLLAKIQNKKYHKNKRIKVIEIESTNIYLGQQIKNLINILFFTLRRILIVLFLSLF